MCVSVCVCVCVCVHAHPFFIVIVPCVLQNIISLELMHMHANATHCHTFADLHNDYISHTVSVVRSHREREKPEAHVMVVIIMLGGDI